MLNAPLAAWPTIHAPKATPVSTHYLLTPCFNKTGLNININKVKSTPALGSATFSLSNPPELFQIPDLQHSRQNRDALTAKSTNASQAQAEKAETSE